MRWEVRWTRGLRPGGRWRPWRTPHCQARCDQTCCRGSRCTVPTRSVCAGVVATEAGANLTESVGMSWCALPHWCAGERGPHRAWTISDGTARTPRCVAQQSWHPCYVAGSIGRGVGRSLGGEFACAPMQVTPSAPGGAGAGAGAAAAGPSSSDPAADDPSSLELRVMVVSSISQVGGPALLTRLCSRPALPPAPSSTCTPTPAGPSARASSLPPPPSSTLRAASHPPPARVQVGQEEWDELATSGGEVNPFLLWSFLHALEASGSAVSPPPPQRRLRALRIFACGPQPHGPAAVASRRRAAGSRQLAGVRVRARRMAAQRPALALQPARDAPPPPAPLPRPVPPLSPPLRFPPRVRRCQRRGGRRST